MSSSTALSLTLTADEYNEERAHNRKVVSSFENRHEEDKDRYEKLQKTADDMSDQLRMAKFLIDMPDKKAKEFQLFCMNVCSETGKKAKMLLINRGHQYADKIDEFQLKMLEKPVAVPKAAVGAKRKR